MPPENNLMTLPVEMITLIITSSVLSTIDIMKCRCVCTFLHSIVNTTNIGTDLFKELVFDHIAGSTVGFIDGDALNESKFLYLGGLARDPINKDNIMLLDEDNNAIRVLNEKTNSVWTFAGSRAFANNAKAESIKTVRNIVGYKDGKCSDAMFFRPRHLICDKSNGLMYFLDCSNLAIRKISVKENYISTVIDNSSSFLKDPFVGPYFTELAAACLDVNGDLLITDSDSIRQVHITKDPITISTLDVTIDKKGGSKHSRYIRSICVSKTKGDIYFLCNSDKIFHLIRSEKGSHECHVFMDFVKSIKRTKRGRCIDTWCLAFDRKGDLYCSCTGCIYKFYLKTGRYVKLRLCDVLKGEPITQLHFVGDDMYLIVQNHMKTSRVFKIAL